MGLGWGFSFGCLRGAFWFLWRFVAFLLFSCCVGGFLVVVCLCFVFVELLLCFLSANTEFAEKGSVARFLCSFVIWECIPAQGYYTSACHPGFCCRHPLSYGARFAGLICMSPAHCLPGHSLCTQPM